VSRTAGPWTRRSLLALAGCDLLVLVVVVVSWHEASYRATPQQQIGWFDLAGLALVVGFSSHAGWLVAGRRAVGRRSTALAPRTEAIFGVVVPETAAGRVVTGEKMTLFHAPSCPMAQARGTEALSLEEALGRGLSPCAMCSQEAA
jgi:drug/metabolite transporter (DMT)-like permease